LLSFSASICSSTPRTHVSLHSASLRLTASAFTLTHRSATTSTLTACPSKDSTNWTPNNSSESSKKLPSQGRSRARTSIRPTS
jgi:hypothetical protein